jgi:hypothetical protein
MIIYNVTTKVDQSIADAWITWMRDEYNPEMLRTGCFTHAVVLKLIDLDEMDHPTFAVQYHAPAEEVFRKFIDDMSAQMSKKAINKWGDKIISFKSVLEVID